MTLDPTTVIQVATCAFFAILFLQSGVDKVVDRAGNLGWMEPHFANSPLKGMVPLLLSVVTLFEVATGALCAIGAAMIVASGSTQLGFWGLCLAAATLLQLFLGQRLAKDYAGAASLAPYFLVALFGIAMMTSGVPIDPN